MEALALRKPVIMLGRNYHTYNDIYYTANSPKELAIQFRKILLEGDFEKIKDLDQEIAKIFISYFESLFEYHPWESGDTCKKILPFILDEIYSSREEEKEFLNKKYTEI